jgi:hypothetical protein
MTLRVCPGVAGTLFLVVSERIERIEDFRVYVSVGFRRVIATRFDPP